MNNKTYYGKQTVQAMHNFPFSYPTVRKELIYAMAEIKEAAAVSHKKNGDLIESVANAIIQASQEIRKGIFDDQFLLSGLQGGAGTSIHMNVNEVIASRAQEILLEKHDKHPVHPNDHVNKSQSTNDVNPSALKIACIRLTQSLVKTVDELISSIEQKASEFVGIDKLARTHLQDAIPMTLSEEFTSYADTVKRDKQRLLEVLPYLLEINLTGTAIGNCINASVEYRRRIFQELPTITSLSVTPAPNLLSQTSSQTDFVMLSHAIVILTLALSKIASDIRLLASGPQGGFGELVLEELQSGSSIMPGKVNPVIPESINQLYFLVSGNNTAIEMASHAAQLELGVMFPILADKLLSSLIVSRDVIHQFASTCIPTIQPNVDICLKNLESSTAYATLLTSALGYDAVSSIVKESLHVHKNIRQLILEKHLLPEEKFNRIVHMHRTISRKK